MIPVQRYDKQPPRRDSNESGAPQLLMPALQNSIRPAGPRMSAEVREEHHSHVPVQPLDRPDQQLASSALGPVVVIEAAQLQQDRATPAQPSARTHARVPTHQIYSGEGSLEQKQSSRQLPT